MTCELLMSADPVSFHMDSILLAEDSCQKTIQEESQS